jgi:[protein-PII] uridylyltransferase
MKDERQALLDDTTLVGRAWCEAYTTLIDDWLVELFRRAARDAAAPGIALAAVGGYGRGELAPQSDIDLLLLHRGQSDVAAIAERLWYPIWDEGLKLGHSVRTVKEALSLAEDDLDTATSLLSVRHLGGDPSLSAEVAGSARERWQKRAKRRLEQLATSVEDRHRSAGEVAFLLEPDLKEGRGGLRDVHALGWAEEAQILLFEGDAESLRSAYGALLDARVELHRRTGRPGDTLVLQEQDGVADALGFDDADALMRSVSGAARTIAWTSDDTWRRITSVLGGPLGRRSRRDKDLAPGLVLRDGEVHVTTDADPAADPALVLRAAALAAANETTIDRTSIERLAADAPPLPDPWPAEARTRLAEFLLAGPPAVGIIEALDQRGLWTRVLPEWEPTRSHPQRNAYHTYTVDRHLVEAAVGAAALAGRVDRPDLLVIGTLLHDIGKGRPGDHTVVGMELVSDIGRRMGFPPADVATLVSMVEHHLLLPDVATRRDLDDPGTIDLVAKAAGDVATLRLLAALTEGDSLATGPAAWGGWKAQLVHDLVERTAHVLEGGSLADVPREEFPTAAHLDLMAAGSQVLDGRDDTLTVIVDDRPGTFAKVAGVLALHGLGVLDANAWSSDPGSPGEGMALSRFRVESAFGPVVPWDRVVRDLEAAFAGRLALTARLHERARTYAGRRSTSATPVRTGLAFDNRASRVATVIDVLAPDSIGLLHRIAKALAELDLDIRSAKVSTIGPQVVDAFYVRTSTGEKLDEEALQGEVSRAVLHAVVGSAE